MCLRTPDTNFFGSRAEIYTDGENEITPLYKNVEAFTLVAES